MKWAWALYSLFWIVAICGTVVDILETGGHPGAALLVAGVEAGIALGLGVLIERGGPM